MAIGFKKTENVNEQEEVTDLTQEETTHVDGKMGLSAKIIVLIVAAVMVIMIVIVAVVGGKGKTDAENTAASDQTTEDTTSSESKDNTETAQQGSATDEESQNNVYNEDGTTKDPYAINPGAPDYEFSTNTSTTATVYNESDFIKDLNGLDVSAVYNVESRDYVQDYISYETRRAQTSDGMELYWLEAEYKGKPYRVQVPFYYFKDLGTSGICKVEVEILNLVGGGKVVSYMQVIEEDDLE